MVKFYKLGIFIFFKNSDWFDVTDCNFFVSNIVTKKTLKRLVTYLRVLKEKLALFKTNVIIYLLLTFG